jgi:DNA-directed RNA polymerase subunit RPC12/RpoP
VNYSNRITDEILHWSGEGGTVRKWRRRLSCALFGHKVSNHVFDTVRLSEKHCNCGMAYLRPHEETRVSHTVSCFVIGHRYARIAERSGHNEYVCLQCGHPLLFKRKNDPYARTQEFTKKVRYLCNLLGHRVHAVAPRNGMHEYACDCGHSFLMPEAGRLEVKHPVICLFAGHFLAFTEKRGNYDEYVCRNCGHTFYFTAAM